MKPFSSSNKDPTSTDKKIISLTLLNFTLEVHIQPTLPPDSTSSFSPAQIQPQAARTPNAISLDASEKESLLELRYTLILLSNI